MKKNHNIRRFICALIAAGMLTSAASTGVFADSPSNDHPGNSQTQGPRALIRPTTPTPATTRTAPATAP